MLETFSIYIITFTAYSLLGWLAEVIYVFLDTGYFYKRGFLYGPFLPIYGVGALTALAINYTGGYESLLVIFAIGALTSTLIEYLTHFSLEKIFSLRLWDYRQSKFNLHGRIKLKNSVLFGLGTLAVITFLQPMFNDLLLTISPTIKIALGLLLLLNFLIDWTATLISLGKIKRIQQEYPKLQSNLKDVRRAVDARFATRAQKIADGLQNIPEALINRISKLNTNTKRLLFRILRNKFD